jgi:hypothetical protein
LALLTKEDGSDSYGSLILGGYDSNKFINNDVGFPFHKDDQLALTVNLRSITLAYSKGTMEFKVDADTLIDSNRPYIILPTQICNQIARNLQLNWDDTSQHYLISNETHSQLNQLQPVLTFEISPINDTSKLVRIAVPYESLSLRLSYPKIGVHNDSYYFPILRSDDPAQYTLGRAFMQDAYVISDYERKVFQVKQVDWNSPNFSATRISRIDPRGQEEQKPQTNTAAQAGIGIGIAILFFLIIIAMIVRARRKKKSNLNEVKEFQKPELEDNSKTLKERAECLDGSERIELDAEGDSVKRTELGVSQRPELGVDGEMHEMGVYGERYELPGDGKMRSN